MRSVLDSSGYTKKNQQDPEKMTDPPTGQMTQALKYVIVINNNNNETALGEGCSEM